ncbi:Uncharacterised protein [Mycobacteroides abscessus subsp. abscessus]|nr:Uncharacterised protein [Mycobacteroides abscessus subsp. abscessus]
MSTFANCSMRSTAMSNTMVPFKAASASQLTNDSGWPGATCPLTTTNSWFTAR